MNRVLRAQSELDAARLARRKAENKVLQLERALAELVAARDETSPQWQADHDATLAALLAARKAVPATTTRIRDAEAAMDAEIVRQHELAARIDLYYTRWSGTWLHLSELQTAAEHLADVAQRAGLHESLVQAHLPPMRSHLLAAKTARSAVKALERRMLEEYGDEDGT